MAKGSYNVAVSGDSNRKEEGKKSKEAENQECMDSCPAFLRSLSFHDRRRSARVRAEKELLKTRYKALVSTSLENIPCNPSSSSEVRSEFSTYRDFESVGIHAETGLPIYNASSPAANQEIVQNSPSDSDRWHEDRHSTSFVEAEKLLEKTIAILRTVDKDISESLVNLTKPESIALESVMEVYRNKGISTADDCADSPDLDLSTESFNDPVYENWQSPIRQRWSTESSSQPIYENWEPPIQQSPKNVQAHSTPSRPKTLQTQSSLQSPQKSSVKGPKNWQPHSAQESPKNLLSHSSQQSPENVQAHSSLQNTGNLQASFSGKSSKNVRAHSTPRRPKTLQTQPPQQTPKNVQALSSLQCPANLQAHSSQKSPTNLQAHSSQKSPKNLQAHSSQQSSENLVHSARETLKNFQSPLDQMTTPDSDGVRSVEQSPGNVQSSPKISSPGDTTEAKSLIHFNLPSDHEQFLELMGALQNRCLEYREMNQDIAVSALDECLNFSDLSINRIRRLRRQFVSQKRNFRDFKALCYESVVFGPDSQPIDQKVTELIQSFYLKLLQEENETFMVRVEFGLKMAEMYAKMLRLETESKKAILTLEKEILYLKKTSVGFRV